jgi:hypothetical protein
MLSRTWSFQAVAGPLQVLDAGGLPVQGRDLVAYILEVVPGPGP